MSVQDPPTEHKPWVKGRRLLKHLPGPHLGLLLYLGGHLAR